MALGISASIPAELVPGVDLVPFWTLAVVNVYRKWKQITITTEETRDQPVILLPEKVKAPSTVLSTAP